MDMLYQQKNHLECNLSCSTESENVIGYDWRYFYFIYVLKVLC